MVTRPCREQPLSYLFLHMAKLVQGHCKIWSPGFRCLGVALEPKHNLSPAFRAFPPPPDVSTKKTSLNETEPGLAPIF